MELNVISQDESVIHVACAGTVTLVVVGQQRELFENLLGPGCFARTVLLDMRRTDYLDSSGISWLILSHKNFCQGGGRLILHSLPPALRRIIELTRLASVLHLADDEPAARALAAGPRS